MLEYQTLWNSITLSVNIPRDWIEFYLRRVPAAPLSLHMTLYRGGDHSVATTITPFLNVLRRCRLLRIKVKDYQSLNLVAANVSGITFDDLRVLHLHSVVPQKQLLVPIVTLTCALNHVHSLRLRRIWFEWNIAHTLMSLTTLVLRDIYLQFVPDWSFWDVMATAAAGIEKLSI